jgi:energy-coupling factor transporter transmembrane protein EcfT
MSAGVGALPMERGDALGVLLLGTLAAAMVASRLEVALACVGLASGLAWIAGAKAPARVWWQAVAWGSAFALALNLYLIPGQALPLPVLFGRPATAAGLAAGALVALRVLGAVIAVHGLRAAWPGDRAADHLASWLAPLERLRVPVRGLRETMRLAVRMMPVALAEHRRIRRLQTLRAGGPPRGIADRLERERAAWIPTVVAAVESAERLTLALEARHYSLRPPEAGRRVPLWAVGAAVAVLLASLFLRT